MTEDIDNQEFDHTNSERAGVVDYFGFSRTEKFMLSDGIQYFEIKKLNEGERSAYQNETNRDVRVEKRTGDAKLRVQPGTERHALIRRAVVGWNLFRGGERFDFSEASLGFVLAEFPPEIIDDLDRAIRKLNPWLMGDMTVEDIDREIESLKEQRAELLDREEGKGSS